MRSLRQSNRAGALGAARTCYGHLAGRLGVGITEAMIDRGLLEREDEVFLLTDAGVALTHRLFELGWIERTSLRRAVRVTDEGARELGARLGLDAP